MLIQWINVLTWGIRPLGFFSAIAGFFGEAFAGEALAGTAALSGTEAVAGGAIAGGVAEGVGAFGGATSAETALTAGQGALSAAPVVEGSIVPSSFMQMLQSGSSIQALMSQLSGGGTGAGILGSGAGLGGGGLGGLGGALSIGSSLYGLSEAEKLKKLSSGLEQQADPFGSQRAQYAQQLSALSANPSLITKQPGYQAGIEAVQRTMAAGGYTGSGNEMAALAKYGQDFYNQTSDRYAGLAGAQFNPANAAQLQLTGNIAADQLAGNSLNRGVFGTLLSVFGR